jgi:Ni/Fe-hydrogenase subunit HybB-like protein
MRIAVLVIGLVLSVGLFIQSLLVSAGATIFDDEDAESAAGIGVLMALMWVVGSALAIPLPRVSLVLFVLAGLIGLAGIAAFPDLAFWSVISFALAVFCFFGYRGKRKADARESERDELLRQALLQRESQGSVDGGEHR